MQAAKPAGCFHRMMWRSPRRMDKIYFNLSTKERVYYDIG